MIWASDYRFTVRMGHRFFSLYAVLLLVQTALGTSCFAESGTPLKLSSSVNSSEISLGEELVFQCVLTNAGKVPLTVMKQLRSYTAQLVEVEDRGGNKMPWVETRLIDPKLKLQRGEFVTLNPGQSLTWAIKARLLRENLNDLRGGMGERLVLRYHDSITVLNEAAPYIIKATYFCSDQWKREAERRLGFSNVWTGTVESAPVEVRTVEPGYRHEGGDGHSIETAILIKVSDHFAGVDAEYQFLKDRLGQRGVHWNVVMQRQQKVRDRYYDQITVELLPSGEKRDYYFDITSFYGKIPGLEGLE